MKLTTIKKPLITSLLAITLAMPAYATSQPNDIDALWNAGETRELSEEELDVLFPVKNEANIASEKVGITLYNTPPSNISIESYSMDIDPNASDVGYGMNYITGKPGTRLCIQGPLEYRTASTPGGKQFSAIVASSYAQTDKFFSDNIAASGSGSYGGFSASASYKKSLVRESRDIAQQTSVAFRINQLSNRIKLHSWPDLIPRAEQWLLSGTNSGKANFRKACGDGYIADAVVGKAMYVMIDIQSNSHSLSETKTVAIAVKASMSGFGGGEASRETIDKIKNLTTGYNMTIRAYVEGTNTILGNLTIDNLSERIVDFEKANSNNVITHNTEFYDNPTDKEDLDTFLDYNPIIKITNQWELFLDDSYIPNCIKQADPDISSLCRLTKTAQSFYLGQCAHSRTWSQCYEPANPACTLDDGSYCNALKNYKSTPTWTTIYAGNTTGSVSLPVGWKKIRLEGSHDRVNIVYPKVESSNPIDIIVEAPGSAGNAGPFGYTITRTNITGTMKRGKGSFNMMVIENRSIIKKVSVFM